MGATAESRVGQVGERLVVKIGSGDVDQLGGLLLDGRNHLGWQWPVEITAMPAAKSRNSLPSTSSTRMPRPRLATSG
jgi:hypothetical protein